MIDVRVDTKSFDGTVVLQDASITIQSHETLALLGASGIGKTTLLRIIAGLDTQFEGRRDVSERIGVVFQEPTLLKWRCVCENLALFHPDKNVAEVQAALDQVGLADKAMAWPNALSLGQQRRLSLARAILGEPDVLLLDEPFASLDPENRDAMLAIVADLIDRCRPATLLVTHDRTDAEALADRCAFLEGSPATLREGL